MANYYGQFRSNYFKVKDIEAFKAWCATVCVEVWSRYNDATHFGICADPMSDSGDVPNVEHLKADWDQDTPPPGWTEDEFANEWREIDFFEQLSAHLLEGEVAVIVATGSEKLRYLVGFAVAVNHLGETVEVNINQIYGLAEAKFGKQPGRAEY